MPAKPKLLVTRALPPAVVARAARDYDAVFNPEDRPWSADQLVAAAKGMDGLLICTSEPVTEDLLSQLGPGLKIVATYSVGHDHIDLAACRAAGVTVTNTPDVLTAATADVAMLLLLAAARRAHESAALVREDRWERWQPTLLLGTQVTGKRLGIVGMGRIGQAVARRARGFEMTVHYHNRNRLAPEVEQGAVYHADLDSLLTVSEFLSLHCPASAESRHLLNAGRIARLPDGAVVVNTARGDIVDDAALIAALKSGKLAAAGLDVFEGEPNIDPAYRDLPNAFLLPHCGSATVETRDAMGFRALDNLDAFFRGDPPPDRLA